MKNLVNIKQNKTEYLLVIILIFVSTKTSFLSRSMLFNYGLYAMMIIHLINKKKMKITNNFYRFTIFYFFLTIGYIVWFQTINPIFTANTFINIFISYLVIQMTGKHFFVFFEDIVYRLAIISLPLFVIQQFAYSQLHSILTFPCRLFPFMNFGSGLDANIFVYSMKNDFTYRNSGFMWEPGAFAAFLLLAIVVNIVINDKKLNIRALWILIALLTTLSTMGIVGLIIITYFYLLNTRKKISKLFFIPVFVIIAIFSFKLDFMGSKLNYEYQLIDVTIDRGFSTTHDEMVSLGRMGSFKIDFIDFLRNPIIGVGGEEEAQTWSKTTRLNKTNGLSNYLVTFGGLGMILLLYNFNRSFKNFLSHFDAKGEKLLVLLILVLSFSNTILTTPLFFGFQLFEFFENNWSPHKELVNEQ
jgi:hypothetical protein